MHNNREKATLAGGCFWCTEAIFQRLNGVTSVKPGYAGGSVTNPTYEQVCAGTTGHAEAIQIEFDPGQIAYEKILDIFWHTHDPTTLNRQGHDSGTQYRSVIFYHDATQKKIAVKSRDNLAKSKVYPNKIVTEISPFTNFFVAEDYHQNYFQRNQFAPYCTIVIDPKITSLMTEYSKEIKPEYQM